MCFFDIMIRIAFVLTWMTLWTIGCNPSLTPTSFIDGQAYPALNYLPTGYPSNETPDVNDDSNRTFDFNSIPLPEKGFSTIAGILQTPIDHKRIQGITFYLTKAIGDDNRTPPPVLSEPSRSRGDVIGYTNNVGAFVVTDIAPGNYYMFVWAPYDWRPVQVSEQDPRPKLLELTPNQTQNLGDLYVTWP